MRRWEIALGLLCMLVAAGCSSFVRKIRTISFL